MALPVLIVLLVILVILVLIVLSISFFLVFDENEYKTIREQVKDGRAASDMLVPTSCRLREYLQGILIPRRGP